MTTPGLKSRAANVLMMPPLVPKIMFPDKKSNMTCSLRTDRQTEKGKTEQSLSYQSSSLQPMIKKRSKNRGRPFRDIGVLYYD